MRTIAVGVGVLFLSSALGSAQSGASATEDVLRALRAEGDAIVKKDKAALERLFADDYFYAHSNGAVVDKAADVAGDTAAGMHWASISYADLNARVHGDAAILTGVETLTGTAQGFVPGPRRFTDVWVKNHGTWQSEGGISTIVATPTAATSALKDLKAASIAGKTADERAVMLQDDAYMKSEQSGDTAKAKTMEAKDFSFVTRAGQVVRPGADPRTPHQSLVVAYDRVRVFGTLAVVQGSLLWSDAAGSSPGVLRFLRVWIKDGAAWKIAAEQRTPIAP